MRCCLNRNNPGSNPCLCSYDYEKCDAQSATMMMNYVEMTSPALIGTKLGAYTVQLADNFAYTDPVDGSEANKQVSD